MKRTPQTLDIDITEVWISYRDLQTLEIKNKLVMHYIWLVRYVLQSMNLPSGSILNEDDFLSIGILGLHEAIERFQLDRGVKFESYAIPRIRGIILDELRRLDWLSRTTRKKAHDFMQAGDELRRQEGREVTSEEIRQKLDVTPEIYSSYLQAAAAARASLSINETSKTMVLDDDDKDSIEEIPDTEDINILSQLENTERITFLTTFLKKLSERKRLVMTLYYYENLTFKDIGKVINVSESRVCQIHSQVIEDLKVKLKHYDDQ